MTQMMTGAARVAALALGVLAGGAVAADTAHGCRDLIRSDLLPSVEGDEGHFFRLDPDLMADHRLERPVIAQLAALSRALASRGTTLIYVPVPTKALMLPELLPPEARDLGYDPDLAATLYDAMLKDLDAAGVRTVDARHVLRRARAGAGVVFRTDPRLTAAGAEALASAIGTVIAGTPGYARLSKAIFRSRTEGSEVLTSHMHALLQDHCAATLPPLSADRHITTNVGTTLAVSGGLPDDDAGGADVVVLGSGIAGTPTSNLGGFVAAYSKLDTAHHAVPGDDAFAAITAYLTSEAFETAPPAFLVWTNPVWNRLAARGDQPMRELIAAAGAICATELDLIADPDNAALARADLSALAADAAQTLRLDAGSPGARVQFAFLGHDGGTRIRTIARPPGQVPGSRFYMPLSALWPDGVAAVEITHDGGFGRSPRLTLCDAEG